MPQQEDPLESNPFEFLDFLHQRVESNDAFRRGIQLEEDLWRVVEEIRPVLKRVLREFFDHYHGPVQKVRKEGVHPLYDELVLQIFNARRSKRRHQLAVNALDPDGQGVWENLQELATRIHAASEQVGEEAQALLETERIRTLLLVNAILNARDLNESKILTIEPIDRNLAPVDVFEAYAKVKRMGKKGENASLAFCKELGLFHETPRETALNTIRITKDKAWAFLKQMFAYANSVLSKAKTDDSIHRLSINHRLQPKTLFEWVEVMFDKNHDPKTRIEVQLLLKFMLETFNIRSSAAYQGSTHLKAPVSATVQNAFEEESGNEQVHYNRLTFNEAGEIEDVEQDQFVEDARTIKLRGFDEFSKKIIFIDFDDKGYDAILTKFLTKEPNERTKNIRDHLRCTLVAPDVTLKDLYYYDADKQKPSRGLQYAYAVLKAAGKRVGLVYREFDSITTEEPLEVGEFTIEENLDGPQVLFRNVKLLGIVPSKDDSQELGTTLEIQFNTIDLHEVVNGNNSPFNREHYEGLRWIATADTCLQRSHYKQAHEALEAERRRMVNRRRVGMRSSNQYIQTR